MKLGQWIKTHKPEAGLGGGGIVLALVIYIKSRSSSSSSTGSTAASGYLAPTTVDTTGTDVYDSLEGQIESLSGAVSVLQGSTGLSSGSGASSGSGSSSSAPPPAAAPPSSPGFGFGSQSIGGQDYIELGQEGVGSYYGYNVAGGAPVYYETPGSNQLETDLTSQAVSGLPAGTEVLTPSFWGPQVSANPVIGKR